MSGVTGGRRDKRIMARNEAPTQSRKRSATATPQACDTAPALDPSVARGRGRAGPDGVRAAPDGPHRGGPGAQGRVGGCQPLRHGSPACPHRRARRRPRRTRAAVRSKLHRQRYALAGAGDRHAGAWARSTNRGTARSRCSRPSPGRPVQPPALATCATAATGICGVNWARPGPRSTKPAHNPLFLLDVTGQTPSRKRLGIAILIGHPAVKARLYRRQASLLLLTRLLCIADRPASSAGVIHESPRSSV